MTTVLMLGSAPMAVDARQWSRRPFDRIVAINNAHAVRPDWDVMIHPWDFPVDRVPAAGPGQQIVTEADFVPAQNAYGGFVYAGATMAFTAAYWVLAALKPTVLAVFGCDMQYPPGGASHFYGRGTPDPLRPDITLQSLEAKSARLMVLAARQGCAVVNLSDGPSRLLFPRSDRMSATRCKPLRFNRALVSAAMARETALGYFVPSGRYWEQLERFDAAALAALDGMWLDAVAEPLVQAAVSA
ncbi:MAG: hypothetical protein ACRC14_14920 [Paracoccaceae bacterium]